MKINILYIIPVVFNSVWLSAQVGINTETPRPEVGLDVNSITNVNDRIYIGGNELSQQGDEGENKQVIVSGGSDGAVAWSTKQVPNGFGASFTMTSMNTYYDNVGVNLTSNGSIGYSESNTLNDSFTGDGGSFATCTAGNCWKTLTGLSNSFTIYKPGNKINFMFQTTAQINSASLSSFACGLFLNSPSSPNVFTLKGVRADIVQGSSVGNYQQFNMNVTLENLPVPNGAGGTVYEARIACRGRLVGSSAFGVGKPINSSFLNQDMAQSTLNVFVLEAW